MKIAILFKGFTGWQGGIDFVLNITRILNDISKDNNYDLYCILPDNRSLRQKLKNLSKRFLLNSKKSQNLDYTISNILISLEKLKISNIIYLKSGYLNERKLFKSQNFDIILPCLGLSYLHSYSRNIGYVYDLQHKYLPNNFSYLRRVRRDIFFQNTLNRYDEIIVNAKSVKNDLEKFYDSSTCKIIVLPFNPVYNEDWTTNIKGTSVMEKYSINKSYFIFCNQLWKHKNIEVLLKAFKLFLLKSNANVLLVCTGSIIHSGSDTYFDEIQKLIAKLDIQSNILFLGLIPKFDQINLLFNSIALVQPTLFEGGPGGGSTYEAISLGKKVLLSDIDVNLEIIEEKNVYYFKRHNQYDLCSKLLNTYKKNCPSNESIPFFNPRK